MNLQVNCSTPCFNQFCQYLVNTWRFVTFQLVDSQLNSEALGSVTSGSDVCISACPTSLTPCTLNSWEKYFLHLATILCESATRSPFSSFTILHLVWYPFLKSLMPLYKSLMFLFLLLVSSSSSLAYRYAFFYFPKMSANFTSYIVQIIYIALAWILYPLQVSPFLLIQKI